MTEEKKTLHNYFEGIKKQNKAFETKFIHITAQKDPDL